MKNEKGQFLKGHKPTPQEKIKIIEGLKKQWKSRPSYYGDKKFSPLFNSWRSILYTKKGQKIGHCDSWDDFKTFFEEMSPTYEKGLRLGRLNKSLHFSKENCIWLTNSELQRTKDSAAILEHEGEQKTLFEWALQYKIPYPSIRQRYYRGKNYTSTEILFGKKKKWQKSIIDYKNLTPQQIKNKASKMISAYRCKDKKKGLETELTAEWVIENIIIKPCIYCDSKENVGCDRIDNKKGHTIDNVIPCCYICNTVRNNNFTIEEMKNIGDTIKQIKIKRAIKLMQQNTTA